MPLGIGNSTRRGGGGTSTEIVKTGSASIDHTSSDLPLVAVDLSALNLSSPPAAISARVVAPNSVADVFDCALIAGWTASGFTVRLLGVPEVAGYRVDYLVVP